MFLLQPSSLWSEKIMPLEPNTKYPCYMMTNDGLLPAYAEFDKSAQCHRQGKVTTQDGKHVLRLFAEAVSNKIAMDGCPTFYKVKKVKNDGQV